MTDAIKAGRRRSAADMALGKAMAGDLKSYTLKMMGEMDDFAGKMSDYLKALGFEDEDGDGEVSMDEAEAQAEEGDDAPPARGKAPPFAGKAIDYASLCEMVCSAVEDALDEVGVWDDEEDDDALGDMAERVRQVGADYKSHAADELVTLVYPDFAIAMVGPAQWRIPYSIEGGEVALSTPDAWERVEPEWQPIEGAKPITGAVKMLDDGTIVAQAIRFGGPDEADLSDYRDYFTKGTDFWLGQWERRPMLYHHAMDPGTRDAPVIGTWVKAWADDAGVWLQGQLDAAHKYAAAIKELARRGLLRVSTDSAPHLVRRVPSRNGTHEVKTWPLLAASLTPSPAEPRLLPAELKATLAALGLSIDDAGPEATPDPDRERPTEAKAADEAARRLALALEIDLLDMETNPL